MAIVDAYIDQVQQVYIAYYGRPADPVGLDFWTNKLATANGDLASIMDAFGNSSEAASLFGGLSHQQTVNTLFNQLFGRDADVDGLLFYANALAAGTMTAQTIALNVLNGAQNDDAVIVTNKLAVAKSFTTNLDTADEIVGYSGDTAAGTARSMLSGVNKDTDTAAFDVAAPIQSIVAGSTDTSGTTFTLTNSIDSLNGTQGNDVIDALVNQYGTTTFNSADSIDGRDGVDTLVAELGAGTVSATVANVENIHAITRAAGTLDLINTTGANDLQIKNGSATLTVNNIANTDLGITLRDQASDVNLAYTNAALAGTNNVAVTLNGAQSDGNGGAALAIAQQAGTDTTGAETLTLDSIGSNSNFLNSVSVQNGAATSTVTDLTVTGTQSLTINNAVNASVDTIDASALTGGLTASFANTASAVSVKGGTGNDNVTLTASTGVVTADMGTGDDTIAVAGFITTDVVDGGEGTDTLSVTAANAEAIAATLTNVSNIENLTLNTAGTAAAATNATFFGDIAQVNLTQGTGAGAYGVTLGAGARTLTIGDSDAAADQLGGALTVTDTGTATDDTLTLTNVDTNASDTFNGQGLNINGFETATINTGAAATATQTLGAIALAGDSTTGTNTLNIVGANTLTMTGLTSNSSGSLTVDASGLTGNATLTTAAPTFTGGVLGTVNIVGSNNNNAAGTVGDTILGSATQANTITAGGGIDTVTGGSAADTIDLGDGNDTLNASTGNDTIAGGAGNDTITAGVGNQTIDAGTGNDTVNLDNTLNGTDVVVGGEGTDTLALDVAATAATAAGVSGFETLRADTALTQDMIQFTNNSTFSTLAANVAGAVTFNNVGSSVDTLSLLSTGAATASVTRLVDGTTDALTINGDDSTANASDNATTYATVTVDNEETLTINSGSDAAEDLTITTLNAADLKNLTLAGTGDVVITNAIVGASSLATVAAAGVTGAVTANATASTADMTMTGSLTGVNTLTGGTGADSITGGTANDALTGGNGNDTIDGGAGNDALNGGLGNDTIVGGIGDDTINGGAGNDTLTGGVGADVFGIAAVNGQDTITDFVTGTDTLNVVAGGNAFAGAIAGNTTIATAAAATGASIFAVDNQVIYISANGAAANLTTAGAATLTTTDLSATTLTAVSAYLAEHFNANSGADANDVMIALNWTAGGSTSTYLYEAVNDGAADALSADELTLVGIVERGTDVLVAGDIV